MQPSSSARPTEHPAVAAWRRLDSGARPPENVSLLFDKQETTVYRLDGVGLDGAPVIAKRSRLDAVETERTMYETVLTRLSVPVLHFYGAVADERPDRAWLFVEEASGDKWMSDAAHQRALAEWLAEFHTAAAGIVRDSAFPRPVDHFIAHAKTLRDEIRRGETNAALTPNDREVTRELLGECESLLLRMDSVERLLAAMPRTIVHNDLCRDNVIARRIGERLTIVPFDWEDVGVGAPAIDLAQLPAEARYGLRPDLDAYFEGVSSVWRVSREEVRVMAELGTVFRVFAEMSWESWRVSFKYEADRQRVWLTEFITTAALYCALLRGLETLFG